MPVSGTRSQCTKSLSQRDPRADSLEMTPKIKLASNVGSFRTKDLVSFCCLNDSTVVTPASDEWGVIPRSVNTTEQDSGRRQPMALKGWVAEWSNAPVLKTGVRLRVPWVRIPPHPLLLVNPMGSAFGPAHAMGRLTPSNAATHSMLEAPFLKGSRGTKLLRGPHLE